MDGIQAAIDFVGFRTPKIALITGCVIGDLFIEYDGKKRTMDKNNFTKSIVDSGAGVVVVRVIGSVDYSYIPTESGRRDKCFEGENDIIDALLEWRRRERMD